MCVHDNSVITQIQHQWEEIKNCAVWCAQRQVVFLKHHNYCFSRTIFDRLTGLLWCLLSWKRKNHNEDFSFKWIWDSGGFYYSSGVITFFFHFCLTVKLWKSFNGYKTLPNFSNSMGVQPNRQSKCQLRTLLLDTFMSTWYVSCQPRVYLWFGETLLANIISWQLGRRGWVDNDLSFHLWVNCSFKFPIGQQDQA